MLTVVAGMGSRLLPERPAVSWLRLDLLAGVLLVAAAAYYAFRVVNGDVTTLLAGEPGSPVLP